MYEWIFQTYKNPEFYYFTIRPMDFDAVFGHVFVSMRLNISVKDVFLNIQWFFYQSTFLYQKYVPKLTYYIL